MNYILSIYVTLIPTIDRGYDPTLVNLFSFIKIFCLEILVMYGDDELIQILLSVLITLNNRRFKMTLNMFLQLLILIKLNESSIKINM